MNVLQMLKIGQVHHKDHNTLHRYFVAWLRIEQDGDYFLSVHWFRCSRIKREQSIVMVIIKKIIITSDVNSWGQLPVQSYTRVDQVTSVELSKQNSCLLPTNLQNDIVTRASTHTQTYLMGDFSSTLRGRSFSTDTSSSLLITVTLWGYVNS